MSSPEVDPERYRIGQVLGDAILSIFEAMAAIDGVTLQEAMDDWIADYVAKRIMNPDSKGEG